MSAKTGSVSERLLEPGTFLLRKDAADVLTKAGPPTTVATLEQLAVRGLGPPYAVVNGRAIYRRSDLEAWLASQISKSRVSGAA